jgi:hypothetical protein
MQRLRSKLTYANVVATLALFIALAGGTAFASSQFGKETVGTRALKKESVTPLKLSETAKAAIVGKQGPQGPQGPKGATGLSNQKLIQVTGTGSASAQCSPGETLTGGGAFGIVKDSFPNTVGPGEPGRWTAEATNPAQAVEVRILCSSP